MNSPSFIFRVAMVQTLLDHCRPATLATGPALGQSGAPE
jgi:hypothetical protein